MRGTIAIDPGKTSGVAWRGEDGQIRTRNCSEWELLLSEIHGAALRPNGLKCVVTESFQVTGQTAKVTRGEWSLKIIGTLQYLSWRGEMRRVEMPRASSKTFITDEKLRALGLWRGKTAHERDAVRVLLTHAAGQREPWAIDLLTSIA